MALEAAVFVNRGDVWLVGLGVGLHSLHSLLSEKVVKELYHVWLTAVCYPSFLFCGWSEKQSL